MSTWVSLPAHVTSTQLRAVQSRLKVDMRSLFAEAGIRWRDRAGHIQLRTDYPGPLVYALPLQTTDGRVRADATKRLARDVFGAGLDEAARQILQTPAVDQAPVVVVGLAPVTFLDTYDNADVGLDKVGAFLWYHDDAMNGTRLHVYAGLAGTYLIRDPREATLGLPTCAEEGEIPLVLQDHNLDAADGTVRLLHKTAPDTTEFFGPLTLVNGRLWPRVVLRPEVYRLRILNGSKRAGVPAADGVHPGQPGRHPHGHPAPRPGPGHRYRRRAAVAGRAAATEPGADARAPSERIDVLIDLSAAPAGTQWYLVNFAQAPFGGDPAPALDALVTDADRPGRNPYPWVMRLDVDPQSPLPGKPAQVFASVAGAELNPTFRRLAHDATSPHRQVSRRCSR